MLFGEFLGLWLDTFVQPFRAANTTACYRRAINALPPSVLGCDVEQLNGLQLQAALNAQASKHPRAAQLTYAMLHASLGKAVELGMLMRSPLNGCIKPQHTAQRADVLSVEQLSQYIAAARAYSAYPLLLLMATCGLRRSEALGLMWQDITAEQIHVRRQRLRVNHEYRAAPLKSAAATRVLPLAAPIGKELAAVRVRSLAGWVCDIPPETLRKQHISALNDAHLPPVTLHGLRHSMATAAAADGCPIKVLQGILGHARYQLTADLYANHLKPDNYAPSMANLAAAVMG